MNKTQSDFLKKRITIFLEESFYGGHGHHIVTLDSFGGPYVGEAIATVIFDKLDGPGRPPEDGKRVALYLAFRLAQSNKMGTREARIWAGKKLGYGRGQSTDEIIERQVRNKLNNPDTTALIEGKYVVHFIDPNDPSIATGYLLDPGYSLKELPSFELKGTGWKWEMPEKTAHTGNVLIKRKTLDWWGG